MGLHNEVERYKEIVINRDREDLDDFVKAMNITRDGSVQIPVIDHPTIEYENSPSFAGSGDPRPGEDGRPDVGDTIPKPEGQGEGEGDETGEDSGKHEMLDLEPEEIEQILEEQYDLEFSPGGEETDTVETEGDMTDRADAGTYKDFEAIFKGGLKRELALGHDEDYLEEVMKVDGYDVQAVFEWACENNYSVSRPKIKHGMAELKEELGEEGLKKWDSIEEMASEVEEESPSERIKRKNITRFYEDDEEYLIPEVEEEEDEESSAIVFNYRDVSGSVDGWDREMISSLFGPMDEYLRTKYDNVRFVYVAHDADAWEVERPEFYQLRSGGGTQVSSALKLIEAMVEGEFDEYLDEVGENVAGVGRTGQERIIEEKHRDVWNEGYGEEWDKYYFGAGDGGNRSGDMTEMTEMIKELPGRKHLHAEINDSDGKRDMRQFRANVADYDKIVAPGPIYQKEEIPDVWRAVFDGE